MKTRLLLLGVLALVLAAVLPIGAATDTKAVNMTATVTAMAQLTLGRANVSFPDADPDLFPSIADALGPIAVDAKVKTINGGAVTLTILAGSNLISGVDTIPISAIGWTATGAGFVGGTMSTVTAQSVATRTGSGKLNGTQSYALTNSWDYAVGNYSAAATYTLSAP